MYLNNLKINNFRNFNEFNLDFKKGLNVITGPNNSGKSGLLKAIGILNSIDNLVFDDFNKNDLKLNWRVKYKKESPVITIEFSLYHEVMLNNYDDELINNLIPFLNTNQILEKVDEKNKKYYEINISIKLNYIIDPKKIDDYIMEVKDVDSFEKYLIVFQKYSNYYQWVITNGINDNIIDKKRLNDVVTIDFIDAERNSETIYKKINAEFRTFFSKNENKDIKFQTNQEISELLRTAIKGKIAEIDRLIAEEKNDIGLKNGNVAISQTIRTNIDLNAGYIIDVKDTMEKYDLPLSHNGVGYNNLINIYLLIKLIELDKNNFRILCLEEPEAHLHPAMQYKLFKYIKKLDDEENLNQQIFVTTHSSNITSVAGLDNIIMINYQRDKAFQKCIGQEISEIFKINDSDEASLKKTKEKSKNHLTKFLDVTRCDLLFAEKIILVEGITEKMLIPVFINKLGTSFEDEHISIVEIGGKYFEHFLFLFQNSKVKRKLLCITDKDFKYFDSGEFNMLGYNSDESSHIKKLDTYKSAVINYVTQRKGGTTLENELFLESTEELQKLLLKKAFLEVECLDGFVTNYGVDYDLWNKNISLISHPKTKIKINTIFEKFNQAMIEYPKEIDKIKKLCFANLYYEYIKTNKGNNILEIITDEDLNNKIITPEYIKEGIEWLLK